MEEQVCMFSKFGFCNFKSMCKRKHYTKEWNKHNCQGKKHAKKDTLKTVRDTLQDNAGSKMIVPSRLQAAMWTTINVK